MSEQPKKADAAFFMLQTLCHIASELNQKSKKIRLSDGTGLDAYVRMAIVEAQELMKIDNPRPIQKVSTSKPEDCS